MVEPCSRCRSTLLSRWIAPVKNVPAGTMTWPPRRLHAAIASRNAPVQSVTPSPTAPKLVTGNNRSGNLGRRTDATMRSAAASALLSPTAAAWPVWAADALAADPRAESSSGAARAPAPVTAVRRSIARRSISWDIFVLPPIDRTVRPLKVVDPQVTPDPQVTACIAGKSWMPARAVTRLRVLPVPPGRELAGAVRGSTRAQDRPVRDQHWVRKSLRIRLGVMAGPGQEFEVAALVGLGDLLAEERAVAALELPGRAPPSRAADREFPLAHLQAQFPGRNVERDRVSAADERERAADPRLGRDVQHAGAVTGPAHPRIRDPHHVPHALAEQVIGDRQHPVLRHPGATLRARVPQHQHGLRGDAKRRIIDVGLKLVIVVEYHGRPGVLQQPRLGGDVLDDGAVRGQVPVQHRHAALGGQCLIRRADHVLVVHGRIRHLLAERAAGCHPAVKMQRAGNMGEAAEEPGQAGTPRRPAMAVRGISALVEPPSASTVATVSSNASAVRISPMDRSSQTISTIRLPLAAAIRSCAESTAG